MENCVMFIEEPANFRMVGSMVRFEVTAGNRRLHFAMSANHFLASFARAAVVAREWRGGSAEVISIERAAG